MKLLLAFALLVSGNVMTFAQVDPARIFIFGHSLLDHRPPAIPTPSNETTVPHWLYLLSEEAGYDLAAGGQYGFLPQHADLPPIAQWGYDIVPGVWDSDLETFAEADINTILITAGNFMQWQGPAEAYPTDPGVSPFSATLDILDWVQDQGDAPRYYVYENWPDMAPYLQNGFPPNEAELSAYADYTNGAYHDWWIEYHDLILAERPELEVRMIPVGPILEKIIDILWGNTEVPILELYEDDAPHGRPSIYFLAALTTWMAIHQEKAPAGFVVPEIVHADIQQSYQEIVDLIWEELLLFNTPNGQSRVFFELANAVIPASSNERPYWVPNPSGGSIALGAANEYHQLEVFSMLGDRVFFQDKVPPKAQLSLEALPAGSYWLRMTNLQTGASYLQQLLLFD